MAYLEGKLRQNSAGGEHTGYVLEVELDMDNVSDADELFGEQVALTGEVLLHDFPERGKILIFKATSAAAIEGDEDEEDDEGNEGNEE